MAGAFTAIADPTRRRILELLIADGASTATRLSDTLGVTRQAVAKHLRILEQADLAVSERAGRETLVSARPDALAEVTYWIDEVRGDWKRRLDLLADHLESPGDR